MNIKLPTNRYYKNIQEDHITGDIWMNMPTFGILKQSHCSGLVITPACDLANAKVETITYLPVIAISSWFASRSFYYEIRNSLVGMVADKFRNIEEILLKNKLPSVSDLQALSEFRDKLPSSNKKEQDYRDRIANGIQLLSSIMNPSITDCDIKILKSFLGESNYGKTAAKLVRNSYSNDLHFLPKDNESPEWSAIKGHSVVLFRYPMTVPIEILDLANDPECVDWPAGIETFSDRFSIAKHFKQDRPLKTLTMTTDFLNDLLTRFVSLYVRVGSPDFTADTITQISNEI